MWFLGERNDEIIKEAFAYGRSFAAFLANLWNKSGIIASPKWLARIGSETALTIDATWAALTCSSQKCTWEWDPNWLSSMQKPAS